jgi:hypothetical protein
MSPESFQLDQRSVSQPTTITGHPQIVGEGSWCRRHALRHLGADIRSGLLAGDGF